MKLNAAWRNDGPARKDYDAPILSISCRFWLASQPTATCSLIVNFNDDGSDSFDLTECEIEGADFEEIAPKVEAWAQSQMDRAVIALKREFL